MSNPMLQIIVLAAVAVFLIIKLKSVLGTREGFEKPPIPMQPSAPKQKFEVIDGGVDQDIFDHAPEGSATAMALSQIKAAERDFNVTQFLQGARGAYEMILMAYERGNISDVRAFLSPEVADSFDAAIAARTAQGLVTKAEFLGLRELSLVDAEFNATTREAEITVRFAGELTAVTKDSSGAVVSGSADEVKRQRDVWSFARVLGSKDPNWLLVATSD
ncbi:MAG: Tim44/TimA family putative adaptor protein [Cypionkella sp.]|nr:Tim44/TimA family putative adaptor protein [Cypionkella sp.]